MSLAVLSIGSNSGDSLAHLRSVVDALGERLVAASDVYRTAPWGGVEQDPFRNAILVAEQPGFTPRDWLELAQQCEERAGRTRELRWGPRTLDVDVIAVHDDLGRPIEQPDADLTLPHPRAHERSFVLAPWAQVQPDAVLHGSRITGLLAVLQQTGAADQSVELIQGESLCAAS